MIYFLTLGLVLFVYMNVWFVISIFKKRNDVADVAWGLGFIMLAWTSFVIGKNHGAAALLVSILITAWGSRLAYHIHARNKGKPEDYRYAQWRMQWKHFYLRSYFQVYLLQGMLLYFIILPVLFINNHIAAPADWFTGVGFVIWLVGFFFEVVGDAQLAAFIKNPINKGNLMMSGLWAYTRHPNYFGEVTQWWGIWVMSLSYQNSITGIIGPVTITFLILKISGVPLLEKKMVNHPQFLAYQARVSKFFPLPPRKTS